MRILELIFVIVIASVIGGNVYSQTHPKHSGYYTFTDIYCSSGTGEIAKKGDLNPLFFPITDTNICNALSNKFQSLGGGGQYQQAYDTARSYIEHCAGLSYSYSAFEFIGDYNSQRDTSRFRFDEYREWLKNVLYLNTDSSYYCADVFQILETFGWFNDVRGKDIKGALAVDSFLVKSGKCPASSKYIDSINIPAGWREIYNEWLDTLQNPSLTPFDSTLPTLEDLDLGILRGQNGAHLLPISNSSIIGSLIASENPFTNETSLRIELNDAALLKLEIYDVLGKRLYSDSKFFEAGNENWSIEGKDLPHVQMYARVSTLSGEVKTIKLQHIK